MNRRDKENLNFILSIDDDSFNEWLSQADDDDLEYALELVRRARYELVNQQISLLDNVDDVSEAKMVIDKIRNMR